MKKEYSDITIVLDRSGSMDCVKGDTIEGFNKFLRDQKLVPGKATITLVQFDDKYEMVYSGKDIQKTEGLTDKTYQPRGMTALLDAIGKTINTVGERLKNMSEDERPEHVIFVIQTDGAENSSHEFKLSEINKMISNQRDAFSWEFVFLGANQDAIKTASSMGVNINNAMTYAANSAGTDAVYTSMSEKMKCMRSGTVTSMAFDNDDRKKQEEAGA